MTNQEAVALLKKNPISVGCAVVCLAVGVLSYFRSDAIPTKEAELAAKSAEGERHALNKINSHDLKEHYDALVAANKEIDSRLVRSSQLAVNSQYFYKLETATGVKLISDPRQTGQTAPKGTQKFTSVAFAVAAQGDLSQLLNFLHQLENGEHYCRILNAQLSGNSVKREAPLNLQLTLELLGLP
jgi:hypothetical protein